MSFENPMNNINAIEEHAPKRKFEPTGTVGKWLKKTSLLTGIIGLAYAGGVAEADGSTYETGNKLKKEVCENIVQDLFENEGFKWSVEYVPKKVEDRDILAERFIKIDKTTHEIEVIGEYDNVVDADHAISQMDDVPIELITFTHRDVQVVETEKEFNKSGFVKSDTVNTGNTHIETRVFNGYGIHSENIVEVDMSGNIVGGKSDPYGLNFHVNNESEAE